VPAVFDRSGQLVAELLSPPQPEMISCDGADHALGDL